MRRLDALFRGEGELPVCPVGPDVTAASAFAGGPAGGRSNLLGLLIPGGHVPGARRGAAMNVALGLMGSRALDYDPNTRTIRMFASAFPDTSLRVGVSTQGMFTLAHEVGHALADQDAGVAAAFATATRGTVAVTNYGATGAGENFAAAYALFVTAPAQRQALWPSAFAFFRAHYG